MLLPNADESWMWPLVTFLPVARALGSTPGHGPEFYTSSGAGAPLQRAQQMSLSVCCPVPLANLVHLHRDRRPSPWGLLPVLEAHFLLLLSLALAESLDGSHDLALMAGGLWQPLLSPCIFLPPSRPPIY
jgi:hypothetical protein